MKESVLRMKEKTQHNIGFPTFKLPVQVLKMFEDWPVKYYSDDFGIWLPGYMIELNVWQILEHDC